MSNDRYRWLAEPVILIVDDHEAVRAALREWLGTVLPNCQYQEASSAEEALALVQARPPTVVLMDIQLPGMNGVEATRRLKQIAPRTHVVIMTIHEDPEYQADARAAGASAYVLKRMLGSELIPIMARLVSGATSMIGKP